MDSYIPEIIEGRYVKFLLDLEKCSKCGTFMVTKPERGKDTFPRYYKLDFDAQAKAAGLVINSYIRVDDKLICKDCAKAGKADFLCALCKKRKPTDKIQEQWGDPPEFLCSDCYETASAKIWEEKTDELYKEHRWDWE